ncbi:MAG: NOP5/NOP56 family protein [Candidatus Micrarchaeia archaeon]
MGREELLEKARAAVKEAYLEKDRQLIQCVNAIDELDKTCNLLFERLQEWYGIYFPELRVKEVEKYCELILKLNRKEFNEEEVSKIVGKEKAKEIKEKAGRSIGVDLRERDLEEIRKLARGILNLKAVRNSFEEYEVEFAKELCPNLTYLIEAPLAAKLIAHAGGLERLARMPASTIQVLGAEKALFKHLRKHTKSPKHGLLFQHPWVNSAPKKDRGKIARLLSTKIAIALKADFYSKNFIADKLKADLEKRMNEIRKG